MEGGHNDDFKPYICMMILSVFTIVCNSVVFFIVTIRNNLRRRPSNKYVLNLMFSNILVACSMLAFAAYTVAINKNQHTFTDHKEPTPEISLMFGIFILLSIMNMILISGVRLYAIKRTFKYSQLSSRKINCSIVLPWSVTIFYFVLLVVLMHTHLTPHMIQHVVYISFDAIALLGFLVLVTSNVFIYRAAKQQLVMIRHQSVFDAVGGNLTEKKLCLKECRLALINIGLVVKFVLFWVPTLTTMNYHLVWESGMSTWVEYLSFHMVLFTCLCDSVIYVLLSRDIRKTIKRFLLSGSLRRNTIRRIASMPQSEESLVWDTEYSVFI